MNLKLENPTYVPIVIVPLEPLKPVETPEQPDILEPVDALPIDRPVVATVVAADVSSVAFAVPVEGPVILAPTRLAPAPPRTPEAPPAQPKPTQYIPSEEDWGGNPRPDYPLLALRRGYQGKVVLEIVVDPAGAVSLVKIAESSGYKILDDTAFEHVRKNLRLRRPPGETRLHTIDVIFQLKK
jgi:protein TonB